MFARVGRNAPQQGRRLFSRTRLLTRDHTSLSLSLSLNKVSVIYRGESLVDLCAGTQGPTDPRPVRPSTLFCVFSAGKAVCSTAVHLLADRGLLGYEQRLSELWPEFACNGKEATTVRGRTLSHLLVVHPSRCVARLDACSHDHAGSCGDRLLRLHCRLRLPT